jgi:hypothetical protein
VTLLSDVQRADRPPSQALFEEARRRRRRRRAVVAVGLAAVVSLIGAVIYAAQPAGPPSHQSGSPPSSSPAPADPLAHSGATLVYSYGDLRIIDASTGASRTLPLPAPPGGASDRAMIRIGSALLLNRGDRAWLYEADLRGAPRDLGPSLRIIPGPANRQVWLWWDACAVTPATAPGCSSAGAAYGQGDVQLVDFSGQRVGRPVPLPLGSAPGGRSGSGWFPTGDVVDGGLVLSNVYGPAGEEVWDPSSERVIRRFPDANVLASAPQLAAWVTDGPCARRCRVHFTNVASGVTSDLPLPQGAVALDQAAFSPDGTTLAVPVGLGGAWPGPYPTALIVIDLVTRTVRLLPGSEQRPKPNFGVFNATWSESGWVFFTAYGSAHVLAWHFGAAKAVVVSNVRLPTLPPAGTTGQQLPSLIAL